MPRIRLRNLGITDQKSSHKIKPRKILRVDFWRMEGWKEKMMEKIRENIRKHELIQRQDKIVVGISGGADSICLAHILWRLKEELEIDLYGVHINHGIRKETAKRDAEYVRAFCQKYEIPFFCLETDIPKISRKEKLSQEEAGRKVRYEYFEQILREMHADKIAVAHHQNDQAETLLLHLSRGSGIWGLAGMRPKRGKIIRPLLFVTREEIEQYLCQNKISYKEDETNKETVYARNCVRGKILPEFEKINERSVQHMAKTCERMQEATNFLQNIVGEEYERLVEKTKDGNSIFVLDLERADPFLQKELIKNMIEKTANAKKDIASVHILDVLSLAKKEVGKKISLPYELEAVREYKKIVVQKKTKAKLPAQEKEKNVKEQIDDWGELPFPPKEKEKNAKEQIDSSKALPFSSTEKENDAREQSDSLGESPFLQKEGEYDLKEGRQSLKNLGFEVFVEKRLYFGEEISKKTYTKNFDYDKIGSSVVLRHRKKGDYLVINKKGEKKSLKRLFIDEKVPRQDRDKIWLFADGSHILWIVGGRISEHYKVTDATEHILAIQVAKE